MAVDKVSGSEYMLHTRQKAFADYKPRLAFYKGITGGYAKGSYLGWNMNYAGATGLAAVNWEEYIRFLLGRKQVQFNQDIPFRILKDIDWEQIYMIDRNKFLYKSIDATLTMQGVEMSSVEMYSL